MKGLLIPALLCLNSLIFAENLLTKECSGFECDAIPKNLHPMWGEKDRVKITGEESYCGKKSLKIDFSKKMQRVFIHAPVQEFKEGDTYTVSAFVKTPDGKSRVTLFLWSCEKLWSGAQTHKFEAKPVTPDWTQIKLTAKLKKDGRYLGILFYSPDEISIYVDEVKLEKGDKASWSEPEGKK